MSNDMSHFTIGLTAKQLRMAGSMPDEGDSQIRQRPTFVILKSYGNYSKKILEKAMRPSKVYFNIVDSERSRKPPNVCNSYGLFTPQPFAVRLSLCQTRLRTAPNLTTNNPISGRSRRTRDL